MISGINKMMKRSFGRFKKSKDGVTAVEFALVGGPFFFVLISIFELGIMLFAEYALAQNVETAGRLIRTGQIQMGTNGTQATPEYFKAQICNQLSAILDCDQKLHVDVRTFNSFSDIAGNLPSPYQAGSSELSNDILNNTQYTPGNAGQIVTVRVYYEWDLVVPGLGALIGATGSGLGNITQAGGSAKNSRLLTAAATFRNEPFSDGS
jgi:Flp pilus assembly protein TadG